MTFDPARQPRILIVCRQRQCPGDWEVYRQPDGYIPKFPEGSMKRAEALLATLPSGDGWTIGIADQSPIARETLAEIRGFDIEPMTEEELVRYLDQRYPLTSLAAMRRRGYQ